jgi:hypothetical protein
MPLFIAALGAFFAVGSALTLVFCRAAALAGRAERRGRSGKAPVGGSHTHAA